jgi:NAD(P)-dependent dehydrogenase (short-subunit alcohol dehydrogenase family)
MLDVNFRSAFYVISAVLSHMRGQGPGRIIAIGSKAAVEPSPMAGVYAASKAALVSLIQTAARENHDQRIAVNVLLPGTMDTPANRAAMPDADFSKWIDPGQVAKLAVYLMSDGASQISGAAIPVDASGS